MTYNVFGGTLNPTLLMTCLVGGHANQTSLLSHVQWNVKLYLLFAVPV